MFSRKHYIAFDTYFMALWIELAKQRFLYAILNFEVKRVRRYDRLLSNDFLNSK